MRLLHDPSRLIVARARALSQGVVATAHGRSLISSCRNHSGISLGLTLLFRCSSRCSGRSFPSSRRKPLFEDGEIVGRDVQKRKAHSIRLDGVGNQGIRQKMDAMVSDFYCEERALGEWLMSGCITTALAEVRGFAPNLPARLQLGSSDFGNERQST